MTAGIKNNRYLILALLFALLNMGAIFFIFGFQQYGDSLEYFQAIRWFGGDDASIQPWRFLKPLGPILAVPFGFLGEGAGLIIQNIVFYLLGTFLIFKIVDLIYHNKKQAFLASVFFVTATPVIESGLAYLTDAGAWFFYLLSLFLTLLYFKTKKGWLIILNGVLTGTGVLMKENGGLGLLFFGLMILLSKEIDIKQKDLKIITFGVFFSIPVALIQILAYQHFRYTSLDWYLVSTPSSPGEGPLLTSLRYCGQLFRILGVLWPFILIGAWREWREKNWERIKIYLALLPSSFSFFLWSIEAAGRAVFIFAPLGILLAAQGVIAWDDKLGKKRGALMLTLLVLTILILNYSFCWFNARIPFTDIIAKFFGVL